MRDAAPVAGRRSVLVGLLGHGIRLSRTPAMHEAEGTALDLNYMYRLFDTADLASTTTVDEVLRAAELCGFAGLNITHPFKVQVISHLHEVSAAAHAIGAVNTVVFRDGKRIGHNTDFWGFAESFRRGMEGAALDCVVQLGAGGAGAAVAHGLADCGVGELRIYDQDRTRADVLATRLNAAYGQGRAVVIDELGNGFEGGVSGLVNTTPVGIASRPGLPLPGELVGPDLWVADIVYFPLETELLRHATSMGCRTLSGSGMAVFQAVRAFQHFTGLTPDTARMEAAFNAFEEPDPG
ncbi:MAG: shikimate dehydrogenase [Rhizobiaceae bacterium]